MTISYRAFQANTNTHKIDAWWNNDGTIGISQTPQNAQKKKGSIFPEGHTHVCMEPLEVKTLLDTGEFHYEGARPGLLSWNEKIDATIKDDMVYVSSTHKGLDEKNLTLSKPMLEEIYKACLETWKKQREGIRPLIGLNSKAKSFDGMAGTLDKDKQNEELRTKVQGLLSTPDWVEFKTKWRKEHGYE